MAHRYATRSTTPTPLIDFTQPLPRISTRTRNSRHHTSIPTTSSNGSNEQRLVQQTPVEGYNNPVCTNRQLDVVNKTTTVPCYNVSFSETPEMITCSICLEALSASREPMATRCGHVFCSQCLSMALKKRKCCPTCQSAVKLSACIRLYF